MTRLQLVGGIEDGFSEDGGEPSRIRPARLPNEYLEAISNSRSGGPVRLRGYDEGGQDKVLIDHFDAPRAIVSGALVVRLRTTPGSDNDALKLGNLDEREFADGYNTVESFGRPMKDIIGPNHPAGEAAVFTLPLETLNPNSRARYKGSFIEFLNHADRPDAIDFEVEDDTAVDVAILVLCQKPQIARGTTFSEFRAKIIAPDVSFLSCFSDKTQTPCEPFAGDRVCTAPLPLACYKPGNHVPTGLAAAGLPNGYATGGEVRATPPVAASRFSTRAAADGFCAGQFGAGWRTLEYHDGAGGALVTYSNIAPRTRLWIDVSDQRYGNCWDRDKQR